MNIVYVGIDLVQYIVEIFKDGVVNEGNEVWVVNELSLIEH